MGHQVFLASEVFSEDWAQEPSAWCVVVSEPETKSACPLWSIKAFRPQEVYQRKEGMRPKSRLLQQPLCC